MLELLVAAGAGEAESWWNPAANYLAVQKTQFQAELFPYFLLRMKSREVHTMLNILFIEELHGVS